MWIVNVVLIFAAIAFISWIVWNYTEGLTNAFSVFLSSSQVVLFALGILLFEAFKAAILAAVIGGAVGLIFFVAKAPEPTTKAAAISIAALAFALLMLKALWNIFHNLRWGIRNEIRNRYRRR